MLHLVKEIKKIENFSLILLFNTDEILKVDLEDKLKEWSRSPQSKFKELLNSKYFSKVKLNKEADTVYWDNGIDLCPDVLYSMGKEGVVTDLPEQKRIVGNPTIP